MEILLISDIHGNYPALEAVAQRLEPSAFDHIINCGDSLVYGPFPNKTLNWLQQHRAISILGNTDKKVIKLLSGKTFKKPSKPEKLIMYRVCANQLSMKNSSYIGSLPIKASLDLPWKIDGSSYHSSTIGIFHGSPARPHEFLFDTTEQNRFEDLAREYPYRVIVTGHSHTPYHLSVGQTHFINPGSVGRMFDGDPAASCAVLEVSANSIEVRHFRIPYNIDAVISGLRKHQLPQIYEDMFKTGRKLN
ncbi:metallophosphoesterase [Desulfopila sp. IMCC35008]|uniref:metallophosphoesterase family protein n=1 Tax=Desulfopila sp. IMCC35008 TaxID=2653858 RepID=UPI0013D2CC22|nr:metallophosphoesterase family protein [Desulfopila sp. IMCC35008]